MRYKVLTAEEAAAMIPDGECVGFSGFANAGAPKVIPMAMAAHARAEHEAGRPWRISLMSGATTSTLVAGCLAAEDALIRHMPYQSSPETRKAANEGRMHYNDLHVSLMAQQMRYGHLERPTTAVIECCEATDDGELTLTTSEGNTPTFGLLADRIILEINSFHDPRQLRCLHDIFIPSDPPHRTFIPLNNLDDRIGRPTMKVDPEKIVGVVLTHEPDYIAPFKDLSDVTLQIGENMRNFLEAEYLAGRIPAEGLPLQSGVGNVANAVLASVGQSTIIPPFKMHTEVLQDTVVELMKQGRCLFASSCCIHVCDATLQEIYRNFDFYRDKILLRPVEVSNNPAIARRIGLICMNTALEVDIFGNVNSTHIAGTHIMNGIGGSGDFARSSAYTIFSCPSIAKGGAISSVVPMVSHTDHTEHDVHVIITEQGVADLRGLSPRERAELIIENCAHPEYRPMLRKYLARTTKGHTPHDLRKAFSFHNAFTETGDMRNADLD